MTVAVATPFNMDEQAFLQTMDRLIERFDRYSSGRCFADLDRIRLEHDMEGPLSLFDDVVHELADDLFGGTSWPVNLDMDMIILDRFQIGYDAEFLTGCRNVVRKYGMSALMMLPSRWRRIGRATGCRSSLVCSIHVRCSEGKRPRGRRAEAEGGNGSNA